MVSPLRARSAVVAIMQRRSTKTAWAYFLAAVRDHAGSPPLPPHAPPVIRGKDCPHYDDEGGGNEGARARLRHTAGREHGDRLVTSLSRRRRPIRPRCGGNARQERTRRAPGVSRS